MNILITGGANGLGRELANHLAQSGNSIIIIDRIELSEIDMDFNQIIEDYYCLDLADTAKTREIVNSILMKYPRIDLLINNASYRIFKEFTDFSISELTNYINVNLRSLLLVTQLILKRMHSNNFGRIINISSISAFQKYTSGSLYCSTKLALIPFTEIVGRELSSHEHADVTINTICPDSFQKLSGQKLREYNSIINSVTKLVKKILNSSLNGQIFYAMNYKKKLLLFLSQLIKSIKVIK